MGLEERWKLTSYFGERTRVDGRFFSDVLLDAFAEHGIAGSALMRASGGFGVRHRLRTDSLLTLSEDPSVVAVALDTPARLRPVLERLPRMQPRGMATLERARVLPGSAGAPAGLPDDLSEATRLTVQVGRRRRAGGVPAYVAVCALLHRYGVDGASVLVGVDGTSDGVRRRARFTGRNRDVPAVVIAVGEGSRVLAALPALADLIGAAPMTLERVRVCKRDGRLLAPPDRPAADWQKLTVITSESHLHAGRPVHRALLRELRGAGAQGATVLRGAWGFRGDHAPHGDRLFQLGRRVPVMTTLVDRPARVAELFEVVDELTREHGLVTAETVPALWQFGAGHPGAIALD